MSFRSGGVKLVRNFTRQVDYPSVELPAFLCPALLGISTLQRARPACSHHQRRQIHSATEQSSILHTEPPQVPKTARSQHEAAIVAKLPAQCAGCGAMTQTIDSEEPGYFNVKRKTVRDYLEGSSKGPSKDQEMEKEIIEQSLNQAATLNPELVDTLRLDLAQETPRPTQTVEPPMCERCHKLKHHEIGVSIHHPSVESIEDTIFESPHKYNHIYHVIDAADFPMSLVPGIHKLLNLTPMRSLNRRSKTGRFYHGKKTEISFIITRSDLLAPLKEQVDAMMPYLRNVLRTSLGRVATDVRLGNLRCVSAKRAWWTKELKEDIWNRGGGGWMVGKVNVGKSQLFHEVFPKGRRENKHYGPVLSHATARETEMRSVTFKAEDIVDPEAKQEFGRSLTSTDVEAERLRMLKEIEDEQVAADRAEEELSENSDYLETGSLLPPAQVEVDYPAMPLVSALPGTTASPIRVPFGNGKGELIDLPGLSRGDLELFVKPEHRSSLVMRSRVRPEQKVIKPGQSLLLGGLIRITPTTPDVIFLAYSFNPLTAHLTSTEKAIGTQTEVRESTVENIAIPGTGAKIASAGTFHLKWDVTRQRTGPITARDAAAIHPDKLPYKVMAADILIEGCGWVELVAQVRKYRKPSETTMSGIESWGFGERNSIEAAPVEKPLEENSWGWGEKEKATNEIETSGEKEEIDPLWPAVEVFTPEGRFAGVRQPMNAWSLCAQKPSEKKATARPRKSMKGVKKLGKVRARAAM